MDQKGNKTGGRTKGTPNRDSLLVKEACERLDFDPLEIIIHFAKGDFKRLGYDEYSLLANPRGAIEVLTISPDLRAKCAKDLLAYLYPKRKSLDINFQDEEGKEFKLSYSKGDLVEAKKKRQGGK